MTTPQLERAADAFAAALVQWRAERGLSKKRLAAEMGFDPSYISHVEARRHRPTHDVSRSAWRRGTRRLLFRKTTPFRASQAGNPIRLDPSRSSYHLARADRRM